jgi:threonine synthase
MDIQVSSNFERLLFEAEGRDAATVRRHMAGLAKSGAFALSPAASAALAELFSSGRADEAETAATIRVLWEENGYICDPHSAVGIAVARRRLGETPMITQATAHPGKFPDAVTAACAVRPELPAAIAALLARREDYVVLPADHRAVKHAIEARTRASRVAQ